MFVTCSCAVKRLEWNKNKNYRMFTYHKHATVSWEHTLDAAVTP